MWRRIAAGIIVAAGPAAPIAAAAAEEPGIPPTFFRLSAATTLPGKAPDWDYLGYLPASQTLLIGRRDDGLWVFDTQTRRLIRRLDNSAGAGAVLTVPALDRGYSTNEDGSTTVFKLSSYATIARIKFADDADSGSYDPTTGQIAFMSGASQKITFIAAQSLKITGTLAMASKKLEASAVDGAGSLFVAERDRNMLAQIDMTSRTVRHEWPTTGCTQPTGMALDAVHHRAFLGCRGARPVLAVIDTGDGHVVATLDLGRGNDGVVYDGAHARIFTTNGSDANLVVYHQDDPDHYRLEQAITTRPSARTIAYDPVHQQVFTVAAEGVVDPARPINSGPSPFYPNAYYDDSFVVLTYAPAAQPLNQK